MLGSLLPGLREIRAPLAAGYAWLLAVWLALEPALPTRSEATGIYKTIIGLDEVLSILGVAAVVSAVAYLAGSVSDGVFGGLWSRQLGFGGIFYTAPFSGRGQRALLELVRRRADEAADRLRERNLSLVDFASAPHAAAGLVELQTLMSEARKGRGNAAEPPSSDPEADARAELAGSLEQRVTDELDLLRTRLLGVETDLFGAVDRMRAEAELRFAVAPPLIAIIGVFVVRDSILWLFALIAVVVLVHQARRRLQDSGDMLIDALRVGRVDAPSLERLAGELESFAREGGSHAPAVSTPAPPSPA